MDVTNYSLESLYQYAQPAAASAPQPQQHRLNGPTFPQQFPKEFEWISTSTFDFAVKMREVLTRWGGLTAGQLAAVQRCMGYQPRNVALKSSAPGTDLSIASIPAGLYAVPQGATRLKVCIKQGTGKWKGWVFVSDAAVYGQRERYGAQRPSGRYEGKISDALALIAADPAAASAEYGRLTGTCGVCGRPLENEESVARGIGPVCAGRMGW